MFKHCKYHLYLTDYFDNNNFTEKNIMFDKIVPPHKQFQYGKYSHLENIPSISNDAYEYSKRRFTLPNDNSFISSVLFLLFHEPYVRLQILESQQAELTGIQKIFQSLQEHSNLRFCS